MLYQLRDSKSRQLDEQVMGRVRRNPCLLNFEDLSQEAQKLAMTAWVWGIKPEDAKKVCGIKLYSERAGIVESIKVKVTRIKPLEQKADFDWQKILKPLTTYRNIFELGRRLKNTTNEVRSVCYGYAADCRKWWQAAEFIEDIEKECNRFLCDYAQSMEVVKDENGNEMGVSFALTSHYIDNGNYVNIGNWVWQRRDRDDNFSFDSDAERRWAGILKDLSFGNLVQKAKAGRKTGNMNQGELFDDEKAIFLWGKNYVPNSVIKFEYYDGAVRSSFPDFVMKDAYDRIHIFEVKSVNVSSLINIDSNDYESKIAELKKCYRQASAVTNQIFYLPVMKGEVWQIARYANGEETCLTKEEFEKFVKTNPS